MRPELLLLFQEFLAYVLSGESAFVSQLLVLNLSKRGSNVV